ncbi:MAG: hypothetical protein IPN88_11625 [Bacteroidetes bacterium]|nr:hypothetical protein [Bacteroidota bacterium]
MNKLIFTLLALSTIGFTACNQQNSAETDPEKDSLIALLNERNESINEFILTFNEVESNLDSVAVKQQIITVTSDKPGELKPNQRTKINNEIAAINDLMDQNRKKLADLTKKLKNSSSKNAGLEKTIATLTNQIATKDAELVALNDKLNNLSVEIAQLNTSVTILTEDNSAKAQDIESKTTALHTAYYVVGKSKDLQDSKIIDKKGGLLGIGKTTQLSKDFDNSKFTKIDYTQTGNISINSEIKIVTNHPSDSYTLETDEKNKDLVKNIIITNPEKFWSTSKYLVIVSE